MSYAKRHDERGRNNAKDAMERAAAELQIAQGKGSHNKAALIVICMQEIQIQGCLKGANGCA